MKDNKPEAHWFLVVPQSDLFLLGRPLLEAWKAEISMGSGKILLQGKTLDFPTGTLSAEDGWEVPMDVNAAELKGFLRKVWI